MLTARSPEVFYGCVRYQKFLRIFVTGFLYKNPATAQRSDQTLYTVRDLRGARDGLVAG